MGFLVTALIMFCFWIVLSGYFDFFHILTGTLSSLFVAYVSRGLLLGEGERAGVEARRTARFVMYLPWLFLEIFKANIDLVYRTLHPRMPIDPRVITFGTDIKEDRGLTTLANSITLTPGTVTIGVEEGGAFTIHAISAGAAESLLSGEMAARVKRIEGGDV